MAAKKTVSTRTRGDRLGALEQFARQHGKDIREIKEALVVLQRDVEFLKASDSLILKEMREGFARIEERFGTVFDHLDGISKQVETLSQEYVALKLQVQRLEERVARLEAERSH